MRRNGYALVMQRNTKWGRNIGSDKNKKGQRSGEERWKIGEPTAGDRKAKEGKEGKVTLTERSGRKRMSISL